MKRRRKAKIIATLGPASTEESMIRGLFEAGADVFRLNFSHGSHADHMARFETLRRLEQKYHRPVTILQDLQGPKIRIGTFAEGPITLERGSSFRFDSDPTPGDATRVHLPHPELLEVLSPGQLILLDDGKRRLEVVEVGEGFVVTRVVTGGILSDRKGVNLPGVVMPISPLTPKDREDLAFGLSIGVDWIALSFVQTPEDVAELKAIVKGRAGVMAKIEKPAALDRLSAIVEVSDAIMIARGDLGVEVPPEDVPGWQKEIIRTCRLAGKPVVVATQMLDSMVMSPAPTRAEASDVALAIYDGADAVMLSAESAAGHYPLESVAMMDRIIARTESDKAYRPIITALHPETQATSPDAISAATADVSEAIAAASIVTFTASGATALRVARHRPVAPLLTLTPRMETARRLGLVWGTHCVHTQDIKAFQEMAEKARSLSLRHGFAETGQQIVITAGVPFGVPGQTNVLHILKV